MADLLRFTIVGIVTGSIYAVAASGLVVTFTTSGIFNFAHGAVGMLMAFVYWQLTVEWGWPVPLALVVVLFMIAPLFGALLERTLMRRLHGSPTGVSLVVTVALLAILLGGATNIWPPQEARTLPAFFSGTDIDIAGVVVTVHELIVIGVAIAVAVLLRFVLFHTRAGVTMRAVVDNRELSALNGAYPERVAQLSWAMGAVLAAAAGILIAPAITLSHVNLTLLVINGYAAAMLGRLRSLPLTFVGAVVLGLIESYAIGYGSSFSWLGQIKQVLPTIFLFAILVALPQAQLRAGRIVGARTPRVPGLRQSVGSAGVFVVAVGIVSTLLSDYWLFNASSALVLGIVMLSLVLLSGYAGQVSLMQMTFVGVGALAAGRLFDGSPLGLVAAAVVAGAFGALVALPALRLQDLYLALATLALAVFAQWAWDREALFGRGGILAVDRFDLPGVSLSGERAQLVLLSVAFAAVAVVVLAIRRGPYGRRLAAMRDSPAACATLGLNLVATKTAVFAISAAIAGVAGALYGGLRTSVSPLDFQMLQSLFIFLAATIGGITTVAGALLGGVFLALLPEIEKEIGIDSLQFFALGVGAILLASNPNGFGGSFAELGTRVRTALAGMRRSTPAAEVRETAEIPEVVTVR
jgi:branched-chain amino acid transport system permease protein